MTYTTRETILQRIRLAEQDEESPLLGTLRLRELTRQAYKDAARWASTSDLASREQARGTLLAGAVQRAMEGEDMVDKLRTALGAYFIGAPESAVDANRWNAALLAAGLIDQATGQPLFTADEILSWPARDDLWLEVGRLAQCVYDLSEIGEAHLKKESSISSPATE